MFNKKITMNVLNMRQTEFFDALVSCILCILLYKGHLINSYLDVLSCPLLTTGALAVVVCTRCVLSFFTSGNDMPECKNLIIRILASAFLTFIGSLFFHTLAVIYGAPLTSLVAETYHFACLLSCTTVVPCCFVLGLSMDSWYRVLFQNCPETDSEVTVRTVVLCSVLGAWLGAFPIPLDWDRPWQVWPISCVIGTVLGHVAGLIISHLQILLRNRRIYKNKLG